MAGSSTVVELLIRARDLASNTIDRVRGAVGGLADQARAALEPLRSFTGLIGGALGLGGANELIERADAFDNLSNQVKVATKSEQEYRESLEDVEAIAQRSRADLDSTARLYAKVRQNADSLGLSQAQVAEVTELVAKGMQLSGSAASATNGAIGQFNQSLASGRLSGEEFNSVMEASPALMKAIADGLGVAVGELRAMAEAQQLTADRVVQGLLSQKDAIDELYGKTTVTVEQRLGQLSNAATLFVGRLNEQYGATRSLGDGLQFLANNLDAVAGLMGAAFAASVAKGAQSTYQFVAASIAARDAARQQAIAAQQQTAANVAAAQGHVAAAQAAYNRALAEQRAAQAQLAALETLAGLFASEEALALARTQSAAAANAATVATQRYTAAQAALAAAQGPAAASAGLFARAMGLLTGPAGLILTAVASFGLLYGAFAKQKPAVDALAQSTDQYAESLKKMNGAQLAGQLLDLNKAIADQEDVMKRARFAARDLDETYTETGETIRTSRVGTEEYIRAQADLADQTATLNDLQAKRAALLERQAAAQREASAGDMAAVTAYNQQVTALDKLAGSLADRGKYLKQVNDAEIAQTQALLDKAKALGDAATAEKLTIQLAGQRAKAAEQAAALARAEAVAEDAKVAALEKIRDLQKKQTPEKQESLALARESAVAKRAEADAAALLAERLQQEARNVDLLTMAESKQVEQARAIAEMYERLKSASGEYYDALIAQAQAEGRERDARALTVEKLKEQAEFQELINQAKQLEASQQREILSVLQQEAERRKANNETLDAEFQLKLKQQELTVKIAEAEAGTAAAQAKTAEQTAALTAKIQMFVAAGYDELEAKRLALLASGQFTAALKIEEEQRKKTTEATKEQKDATKETAAAEKEAATATKEHAAQLAAAGDTITDTLNGWIDRLGALSPAAVQAFESQQQFTESTVKTATAGERAAEAIDALGHTMTNLGGSGFVRQMNETAAAAQQVEATFWGQADAAEQVTEQLENLAETGAGNFDALIREATAAKASFNLLDQARLDNLQQAIDAANSKLRQMQDEAKSAQDRIAELNAEIAAEKGDTAAADQLQLELDRKRALAEAEKNLAAAQAANNAELIALYEEQKRKLQELYDLKQRNLEADIRARENEEKTNRRGGNSASTTASAPSATAPPSAPSAPAGGWSITVNNTINAPNAGVLDQKFLESLGRNLLPIWGNINRRLA